MSPKKVMARRHLSAFISAEPIRRAYQNSIEVVELQRIVNSTGDEQRDMCSDDRLGQFRFEVSSSEKDDRDDE